MQLFKALCVHKCNLLQLAYYTYILINEILNQELMAQRYLRISPMIPCCLILPAGGSELVPDMQHPQKST